MKYSSVFVSLFKIAGCFIRDVQISEKEIVVEVYRRRKTGVCPLCRRRTKRVHKRKIRKVLHEIIGIQKIFLLIMCRSFFCRYCRKRFVENIPFLLGKKRRTTNMVASIVSRLKKESFRSTTEITGIGYHGLRDCLISTVNPFLPNWSEAEKSKPFAMGVDEHYVRKNRYVLSVTNLTAIVIDHFHVIADANRRINEARRIEQDVGRVRMNWKVFTKNEEHLDAGERRLLQSYCLRFPILHCFWKVKEDLREMYRLQTRKDAEKKLQEIRLRMESMDIIELKLWSRTLRRYEQYILNFFEKRTTNGYTEGVHVKCKLTQRISFGFRNIDVYIRKAMLSFLPLTIVLNHHRF